MPQTFGQAKRLLSKFASSYDLGDIGAAVNTAIDELATSKNWQRLRKVRRFTTLGEYFPLPQDCASLIRACVDGKPVTLHGSDYEFLSSGPGDLDYVPAGYAPLHGIQDLGMFPTMYDITTAAGVKLCAFGADDLSGEAIRVRGTDPQGTVVAADITYKTWEDVELGIDGESAVAVAAATDSDGLFCSIERLTLPEGASSYISLYALADGEFYFLAYMHPLEKVPEFRRYRIPGFSSTADASYRVLAEVQLKAVPLVNDWDPLPFDSLIPVQYMLQSMWYMNSGEVKAADEYRQRAMASLAVREEAQQERQGVVVINTQYSDSLGDLGATVWQNI